MLTRSDALPPAGFGEEAGEQGGGFLEVPEEFGRGVHRCDAGADVAGEVFDGLRGCLESVHEGVGCGLD